MQCIWAGGVSSPWMFKIRWEYGGKEWNSVSMHRLYIWHRELYFTSVQTLEWKAEIGGRWCSQQLQFCYEGSSIPCPKGYKN